MKKSFRASRCFFIPFLFIQHLISWPQYLFLSLRIFWNIFYHLEFPASFVINRFSNVIDAMLCYAMHLFLLDLYNEMMQCYLNTCNGLMQNALHFHFFCQFSKSLLRVFQSNTLFTSFIVKCMIFSKTKLPFLEVINIIYFSFYYLPSIRVSSYSKLSMSDYHSFRSFPRFPKC